MSQRANSSQASMQGTSFDEQRKDTQTKILVE